MHIFFEPAWNGLKETDSRITSLSWMGKVPEEVPDIDEWQLNRQDYYREGWLATGNIRGTVGVTYTSTYPKDAARFPPRTNFNLRGHRAKITLVQWNEPYQKLATCDATGVIFVWIRYEGRWSIELINDRNTPVVHFQWSHDGRMALICYKDGFVLVGSVGGQRFWSSMMNLESDLTHGLWTPDDLHVYLATARNDLLVLDVHGVLVSRGKIVAAADDEAGDGGGRTAAAEASDGRAPSSSASSSSPQPPPPPSSHVVWMAFNCPKFKMEEIDSPDDTAAAGGGAGGAGTEPAPTSSVPAASPLPSSASAASSSSSSASPSEYVLAALSSDGALRVMKASDDPCPVVADTGLRDAKCEWSNSGLYLALCGNRTSSGGGGDGDGDGDRDRIELRFYRPDGSLAVRTADFPLPLKGSVGSLTWGHNDARIIFSVGRQIIVGWVWGAQNTQPEITSLQALASVKTFQLLPPSVAANLQRAAAVAPGPHHHRYQPPPSSSSSSSKRRPPPCRQHPPRTSRRGGPAHAHARSAAAALPLPTPVAAALSTLASPTIQSYVPDSRARVREFVTRPPRSSIRLYCTMLREDSYDFFPVNGPLHRHHGHHNQNPASLGSGSTYTLYLEFLGGLLPLLKGKRISRLRPDFLIYDPEGNPTTPPPPPPPPVAAESSSSKSKRKNLDRRRRMLRLLANEDDEDGDGGGDEEDEDDEDSVASLPETDGLAMVLSNIWGTKFRVAGLCTAVPEDLGHVLYRTSLLHLQPRQMTIVVPELGGDVAAAVGGTPSCVRSSTSFGFAAAASGCNSVAGTPLEADNKEFPGKRVSLAPASTSAVVAVSANFPSPSPSPSSSAAVTASTATAAVVAATGCSRSRSEGVLNVVDSWSDFYSSAAAAPVGTASRRRFYFAEPQQQQPEAENKTSPFHLSASSAAAPKLKMIGKSHSLDSSPSSAPLLPVNPDVRSFMLKLSQNYQRLFSDVREEEDGEGDDGDEAEAEEARDEVPSPDKIETIVEDDSVDNEDAALTRDAPSQTCDEERIMEMPWSGGSSSSESSPVRGGRSTLLCGGSGFSRSLPSTPLMRQKFKDYVSSPIKNSFLASPIMSRRRRTTKQRQKAAAAALSELDADYPSSPAPAPAPAPAQKPGGRGRWNRTVPARAADLRSNGAGGGGAGAGGPGAAARGATGRQYVLFNKAPIWNETNQVYQLDFGGRVTQESAKNFQIEHEGAQVMQFGRVDTNAYTLDFQHPFSAVQAFAISLANVTQRLK